MNGSTIDVNDEITVAGYVVSVSGRNITVQGINSNQQFIVDFDNLYGPTVSGAGRSLSVVAPGDPVTLFSAVVQSTSGVGAQATHVVTVPPVLPTVAAKSVTVAAKDSFVKKTH
jgi:hypothetical protein